jgi:thiol-disulfide isomerase/thioredoxin
MRPVVDGLVKKYAGTYDIKIVNLSKGDPADEQLYNSFDLQYVPTFVLLNSDGSVAEKIVGSRPAAELEAAFAKLR